MVLFILCAFIVAISIPFIVAISIPFIITASHVLQFAILLVIICVLAYWIKDCFE
jgi:hypothetical protein